MNQSEVLLPLLEKFCTDTHKFKGKIDLPELFFPHGLSNYHEAEKKYFYIGRDANGWGSSFDELFEYLIRNNAWPKVDEFLKYANNSSGGFWTLTARIHRVT